MGKQSKNKAKKQVTVIDFHKDDLAAYKTRLKYLAQILNSGHFVNNAAGQAVLTKGTHSLDEEKIEIKQNMIRAPKTEFSEKKGVTTHYFAVSGRDVLAAVDVTVKNGKATAKIVEVNQNIFPQPNHSVLSAFSESVVGSTDTSGSKQPLSDVGAGGFLGAVEGLRDHMLQEELKKMKGKEEAWANAQKKSQERQVSQNVLPSVSDASKSVQVSLKKITAGDQGQLTFADRLRISLFVLEAVRKQHQSGVGHGNLEADSIMLETLDGGVGHLVSKASLGEKQSHCLFSPAKQNDVQKVGEALEQFMNAADAQTKTWAQFGVGIVKGGAAMVGAAEVAYVDQKAAVDKLLKEMRDPHQSITIQGAIVGFEEQLLSIRKYDLSCVVRAINGAIDVLDADIARRGNADSKKRPLETMRQNLENTKHLVLADIKASKGHHSANQFNFYCQAAATTLSQLEPVSSLKTFSTKNLFNTLTRLASMALGTDLVGSVFGTEKRVLNNRWNNGFSMFRSASSIVVEGAAKRFVETLHGDVDDVKRDGDSLKIPAFGAKAAG